MRTLTSRPLPWLQIAKRQAVVNPENTFFSVKRFIGRKMNEVKDESKQASLHGTSQTVPGFAAIPRFQDISARVLPAWHAPWLST